MARRQSRVRLNPNSTVCKQYARSGPRKTKVSTKPRSRYSGKQYGAGGGIAKPKDTFANVLSSLGFADYASYLASALWESIRIKAFARWGRQCRGCGGPACQIHHSNYALGTLDGTNLNGLWPICRQCHESIHHLAVSVGEANRRLWEIKRNRRK